MNDIVGVSQNCIKLFRRINDELCSLYNIYPLIYKENEWTKAPEGTKLFCYEIGEYLKEYSECSINIEAWYCECDEIEFICGDFIHINIGTFYEREWLIFNKNTNILKDTWKSYHSYPTGTACINKVKPLYKVDVERFDGHYIACPKDE